MCCCCAGRIFPGLLVLSCFVAVCVFACFLLIVFVCDCGLFMVFVVLSFPGMFGFVVGVGLLSRL